MRESISYAFLLNIVIIFIFLCSTIVMGIFSYYRAFRANSIIISEIEKYEGYNCLSKDTIAKKLSIIAYNVPFDVKCKSDDKNCVVDKSKNYAVVSYNLDYDDGLYMRLIPRNDDSKESRSIDANPVDDLMNSKYSKDGTHTKKYQYGVYTYMYTDIPIISSLLKIPFYSRTSVLYEFRNLKYVRYLDQDMAFDYNFIPEYVKTNIDDILKNLKDDDGKKIKIDHSDNNSVYSAYIRGYSYKILDNYVKEMGQVDTLRYQNLKDRFGLYSSSVEDAQSYLTKARFACGFLVDWSEI